MVGGEGPRLLEAEWRQRGVMLYLLSCVFGIAISFTGWRCRALVSATCYTVLGVANKMLTVLANIVVWDDHATPAAARVQERPCPLPPAPRPCPVAFATLGTPPHPPVRPPPPQYAPQGGSGRAILALAHLPRSLPPALHGRRGSRASSAACAVRPPTAPRRCGAPNTSTSRRALQTLGLVPPAIPPPACSASHSAAPLHTAAVAGA